MRLIYLILSLYCVSVQVATTCINNCSNNGVCKDSLCQCNENQIGSDCSVQTFPIQKGVPLKIHQLGTYSAYHVFTETNPIPHYLYLKYDNPQSCTVQVLISQLQILTSEYNQTFKVSSTKSVSLNLSSEVQNIRNVLIIQILSKQNSDFTIFYGDEQEGTAKLSDMPILTIVLACVIPLFAIIILTIIACNFRKIKSRWNSRNSPQIPIHPQIPNNPEQPYIIPERIDPHQRVNLNPQKHLPPLIRLNLNDECSICLQNLLNEGQIVVTPCLHQFHENCIKQVLERQQSCPNCRAPLQPNQLERLQAPSSIQLQRVIEIRQIIKNNQ